MRLFTSIDPPEPARNELGRVQGVLRQALEARRWQQLDQAHLTVHFLGEVDAARLPDLERALRRTCAAAAPFSLELGGVGAFPSLGRPRVLWVGVEDVDGRLFGFQAALGRALAEADFALEERRYRPHFTLAREPAAGGDVPAVAVAPVRWDVGAVVLYRSTLTPHGPIYEALETFPLSG